MLADADVIGAPLNTPLSVLEDPHVMAEGRTLPLQIGQVAGRLPSLPYECSAYKFSVRRSAPEQAGEHTSEVLRELGYTEDDVKALARNGVVSDPGLPVE